MKATLLACCTLIILSGCWADKKAEEFTDEVNERILEVVKLNGTVVLYHKQNNQWPSSIKELETFCYKLEWECPVSDWSVYESVSFKELPDGRLRFKVTSLEDTLSVSGVLDVPE
jgi:hypothetical protein